MRAFGNYARYYNLLNAAKNYRQESEYVHGLLTGEGSRARSLLDVGCGTGRHALEFAKLGYEVNGVDLSEEMLSVGREMLAGSSPELRRQVKLQQGDARDFSLDRKFDAISCLFHVLSYQTGDSDVRQALRNARRHLNTGGLFVFDFWYGPAVLSDPPVVRVRRFEDEQVRISRIAEPVMRPNDCVVEVNYEIWIQEKQTGTTELVHEKHPMRYFFLPEIRALLQETGFSLRRAETWMSPQPLGFDSWNACVVAAAE